MSVKYQRIKQRDQTLWPPARWLLRTFSSIPLAVVLLTCIALYGILASVPIGQLARIPKWFVVIAVMLAIAAAIMTIAGLIARRLGSRVRSILSGIGWIILPLLGTAAAAWACISAYPHLARIEFFPDFVRQFGRTTIYKLPAFEWTELEFYSWWPMKIILGLLVLNLVTATIRRIEFKWLNLGVLTVHTGIITLATGAAFYGSLKVEGEMLLLSPQIRPGGTAPVSHFYDSTDAAVYVEHDGQKLMIPLPGLPRYNDFDPDSHSLNLALDDSPAFDQLVSPQLRARITGFIADGRITHQWIEATPGTTNHSGPAVTLHLDVGNTSESLTLVALADDPHDRKIDLPGFEVGYLVGVNEDWLANLSQPFQGDHALVINIPGAGAAADYHQVIAIQQGQTIPLANTGYQLTVESLMREPPFPVITAGFRGARPRTAILRIKTPDGREFQRWVMYPYPQLTQDFIPGPDGRPQRQPPSDEINIAYLNAESLQLWITQPHMDTAESESSPTPSAASLRDLRGVGASEAKLIRRSPGGEVEVTSISAGQTIQLPTAGHRSLSITVERFINAVTPQPIAVATPPAQRNPRDIGRYLNSLIAVDLSTADGTWSERVWLPFVQYLETADPRAEVVRVDIPGLELPGVALTFGRVRHDLPVALELEKFTLLTYAGSDVPKDYQSTVRVTNPQTQQSYTHTIRLNNPLLVTAYPLSTLNPSRGLPQLLHDLRLRRLKFSQIGWDPQNQSFSILGVGNNPGIRLIALGGILMALGIPFAFYIKPAIIRHRKKLLQQQANPSIR